MEKQTHLRLSLPCEEHPQIFMKKLGISYKHSTPQSIADQWWFWCCKNVPNNLPNNISVLEANPFECIGFGLSKEDAEKISS